MNFVRKGPGYLFLRTEQPVMLEKKLINNLRGKPTDLHTAIEEAKEGNTIVFITAIAREETIIEDAVSVIILTDISTQVIAKLINYQVTDIINKVDLGPGQMVMRVPPSGEAMIEKIKHAYQAQSVNVIEGIDKGEGDDTVLSFSEKPIRGQINSLQLIKESLLIAKPVSTLYQELRRDAICYITQGLDDSQWYELKINIYDADGRYDIQYERLLLVLSDLEAGVILGESWTKDRAFVFLSVTAYQVRLFTILSPTEIKEILLGLEYNEQGNRLVDYDLYYENKKIEWLAAREEGEEINRLELGRKLRTEVFLKLSRNTKNKVKKLETKLKTNPITNK